MILFFGCNFFLGLFRFGVDLRLISCFVAMSHSDIVSSDPYVRIGWPSRLNKHGYLEQFIKSHVRRLHAAFLPPNTIWTITHVLV
jgi:hypothetical protein